MGDHVLQLTPSYPPVVGGIEDHVENLVRLLPNFGYKSTVLTPKREPVSDGDDQVYRESSLFKIKKSVFAPGIIRRLFTLPYDLIHIHAPFHFGLEFGTIASKLRNKPLIITVHMYDARESILYQQYESWVYDHCLDVADRIIPTTADYVKGIDVFERNQERVTPIPLGVDTVYYHPVDNSREKLGYRQDEQILLFVGAMERHHFYKDVGLLMEAVAQTEIVDRLVLVGDGDRIPELKTKAEQEDIEHLVEFPGYVPDSELPTYYSAADLFVLPSKADRGEAFGVVLLEAMACETPVLTTNIPGVRTVVNSAGVVVQPGRLDALIEGIERGLKESFSPREHVTKHYSLPDVTNQIAAVYDSVI